MNPIWKREFIARWRDGRSYLLLLALSFLLSASAYWSYQNALLYSPTNYNFYPNRVIIESVITRSSRTGHALFVTLAIGNVLTCFILAPLLTATGIARERERGLLESLQLSHMSPFSQIVARTLSALSYLAVLQFVTLPVYFVAFSFGGVSELEIMRVWQVIALSTFCGIGLGLAFSAQSTRPSSALFATVTLLVVWTLMTFIGSSPGIWIWFLGVGPWSSKISQTLLCSHPLTLVSMICNLNSTYLLGWLPFWTPIPIDEALSLGFKVWTVIGVLGLLKATRDVKRSLPLLGWAQRNLLIQWWKNNREARIKKQQRRLTQISVEGALLADLPFDRLVRFRNPLLNREVKGRFRLRRGSPWIWLGRTLVGICGIGAWTMVLFIVFFDPPSRGSAFPIILWAEWLLGTALVATFSSAAFAREREAGTWEGIQLSLFSPSEITRSKWASPLLAFGLMSSPLWLMLFVLVPIGNWGGVPFQWIILGGLVVAASLCWVSALGSWISLRAKSTASAICWTIAVLLGLFLGVGIVENSLNVPGRIVSLYYGYGWGNATYYGNYPRYYEDDYGDRWRMAKMLESWNPLVVISSIQGMSRPSVYSYSTFVQRETEAGDGVTMDMALMHVILASLGTAALLLSIRKQLHGRLE